MQRDRIDAGGRGRGFAAMAGQVERDHVAVRRQERDHLPPQAAVGGKAVQKHDRIEWPRRGRDGHGAERRAGGVGRLVDANGGRRFRVASAAVMSRCLMRPLGPVPRICARSRWAASASRRASGLAIGRVDAVTPDAAAATEVCGRAAPGSSPVVGSAVVGTAAPAETIAVSDSVPSTAPTGASCPSGNGWRRESRRARLRHPSPPWQSRPSPARRRP